eukprot:jgi/Galph1/1166/GphlegSOOS_G5808.1
MKSCFLHVAWQPFEKPEAVSARVISFHHRWMAAAVNMPAYLRRKKDKLFLELVVKPGSKRPGKICEFPEYLVVNVRSRPKDGEANEELIETLSKILSIRKTNLAIETGTKGRNKSVSVVGVDWELVYSKLKAAAEQNVP